MLSDDFAGGFEGVIKTDCGYSLVPGHVEGEGQYCAALVKGEETECRAAGKFRSDSRSKTVQLAGIGTDVLNIEVSYSLKGDTVIAVPKSLNNDVDMLRSMLHVVASGCAVGTMKGKLFIPGADLALSVALADNVYPKVDVDRKTALAYLHRDAIVLPDAEKGYVLVCHNGVPIGFVKNLGNRCNSLHPQSRRIRMDIK